MPSLQEQLSAILTIAIPSVALVFFTFLVESINLIFVGHLNNAPLLAGVGLGNIFWNFAGRSLILGSNGALDTLVSQYFGQGNLYMCGVTLNRARLLLTSLLLFWIPTFFVSGKILMALNIPEEVAAWAQLYCTNLIPALYFNGLYDANSRYLQCQNLSHIPTIVQVISIILHVICAYWLVFFYNYGLLGVTYAMNFTQILQFIVLTTYCYKVECLKNGYFIPNGDTFKSMGHFLWLAFTGTLGMLPGFASFEIMTLLSTLISIEATGAQLIILNFAATFYMLPFGLQISAAALVGQSVGQGSASKAIDYSKTILKMALGIMILLLVIINFLKDYIPRIYTNDPEISRLASDTVPFYTILLTADTFQCIFMGVARGISFQAVTSMLTTPCYYLVGLPLQYYLAISRGWGLGGLWTGQAIEQLFLDIALGVILIKLDWQKRVVEILDKLEKEQKDQMNTIEKEEQILVSEEELEMKVQSC